jgi:hypothetical protein
MCWPALEDLSWTFDHLDILLSWAYYLPLIFLAWLLIQSEIEWSKCIVLGSLHLSGTWVIFGCGILVSLGGCCHLDGLKAAEELWQECCLFLATFRSFVKGVVPSPAECQRQLSCIARVIELPYLLLGSYSVHRLDEVRATPLCRRTTKCWST